MTKKSLYILSFTVLGGLTGILNIGLIDLFLLKAGYYYNLHPWYFWIVLASAIGGYLEGKFWWQVIYVQKAYLNWKKASLRLKGKWHWFKLGLLVVLLSVILVMATLWI